MILQGVPFAPGRARGTIVIVGGPNAADRSVSDCVAVADSLLALATAAAGDPRLRAGVVADPRVGTETRAPSIPVVLGLDPDLFLSGDRASVDGGLGTVELEGVRAVDVVTAFLEREDGRILLLRRSDRVGSFQGYWAAVSGFLEEATPLDQAVTEIGEETGIRPADLHLATAGEMVWAREGATIYRVHPFRFATSHTEFHLDWEHSEAEWVDPAEIPRRRCVPKLEQVWEVVRPGAPAPR